MKNTIEISHEPIIAIDFGTSNSLVGAVYQNQKFAALPIDLSSEDPTVMRTLLYFPDPDICYYGQNAISQFLENDLEGRLFRSFKAHLPNQAYLGTVIDNRILSLETMIGLFLLELKKRAESALNAKVRKAVIGRPARYSMDDIADQFAIHRMKKAAQYAGFDEIQFIPEPLAAAFDYRKNADREKIILIGDFGGGTSDFTIMKIRPNHFQDDDVLAIDGCPLAGDAFDSVFMSSKLNQYFGAQTRYRLPISTNVLKMPPVITTRLNNPAHIIHIKDKESYEFIREVKKCALTDQDSQNLKRLLALIEDNQIFSFFETIEKTKRELSRKEQALFKFSYPDIDVEETFLKVDFESWSLSIQQQILSSLQKCMTDANVKPTDIDLVCLTGGTSKVPLIRIAFEDLFGSEKLQTQAEFHSVTSGLTEAASFWQQGRPVFPIHKL